MLDAAQVLLVVADYAKPDPTYHPTKDANSSRWHVSAGGAEFELVLTREKFWDTRAQVGGGGAVDLVMHLTGLSFLGAAKKLLALRV